MLVILPSFSNLTFEELESISTLLILPVELFLTVVFLPSFTTKVPILPLFLISAFGAFTVTSPFKSPFTFISTALFVDKVTSFDILALDSISITSLAFAFFNAS